MLTGLGEGTEIHTQARYVSEQMIDIDVRFYLPDEPANPSISTVALEYLRGQYAQLYDEDLALMEGRQSALDDYKCRRQLDLTACPERIYVGDVKALDRTVIHSVEWRGHPYALRHWENGWIIHSAVCPHRLGPLDQSEINETGLITCPWHGYQFDVSTGQSVGAICKTLSSPPDILIENNRLYLMSA